MTGALESLVWVAITGCAIMGALIVAAFVASLVGELRRVPATAWRPRGEWIERTPPAEEVWGIRRLVLGMTPEQVEDEIARMIAANPDRPA